MSREDFDKLKPGSRIKCILDHTDGSLRVGKIYEVLEKSIIDNDCFVGVNNERHNFELYYIRRFEIHLDVNQSIELVRNAIKEISK